MIKIIDKVQYLKTDPKEFIDINEILNAEVKELIDKIIKAMKKVKVDSSINITVEGKADAIKFSINSKDDKIAKKINDEIDKIFNG